MLRRILAVWFIANFLVIGLVSWPSGGWYLGWPPLASLLAELGLIMLPNFLLSILVLRYAWPVEIKSFREELGWRWQGWSALAVGTITFVLLLAFTVRSSVILGPSIPYEVPGRSGGFGPVTDLPAVLVVLALLLIMVLVTVLGEETMFRGLIQTQVGKLYGWPAGLLLGALLFGLRHLPADLFYGQAWAATPRMWLSRQVQLYAGALGFGLARHLGRSTYASAIAHALFYLFVLFSG